MKKAIKDAIIHDACQEIRNYIETLSDEEFFDAIDEVDGLPRITIYLPTEDGKLIPSEDSAKENTKS